MLIGFVDIVKKPRKIVKITAMLAHYYGLNIIYFTPNDVNLERNTVNGKILINNKWKTVEKELPPILDVTSRSYRKQYRKTMNYLRERAILTFDKLNTPNKEKLQKSLSENKLLSSLVIPTERLTTINKFMNFIYKHTNIIAKPLFGQQGYDVYSIKLLNDKYVLSYDDVEKIISYSELVGLYKNVLSRRKYILQKRISSITKENIPF